MSDFEDLFTDLSAHHDHDTNPSARRIRRGKQLQTESYEKVSRRPMWKRQLSAIKAARTVKR